MVRKEELCDFSNTQISSSFLASSGAVAMYCIFRLNQDATISKRDKDYLRQKNAEYSRAEGEEEIPVDSELPDGKNCCCFPEPTSVTQAPSSSDEKSLDKNKDGAEGFQKTVGPE